VEYITQVMATVGCGTTDTLEVARICDKLNKKQRDVLDCWHNIGCDIQLAEEYRATGKELKSQFTDDEILVLGAYINAKRNVKEY